MSAATGITQPVAEYGHDAGCTVIGGMLAASFLAIFLIPVIFYIIEKLGSGKHGPVQNNATKPAENAGD
jgi:hypothetical protein